MLQDACTSNGDCASGLYCSSCSGAVGSCVRDLATNITPLSISLPFNKYSWLTTHNSYAIVGEPSVTGARLTFENQEDSVTSQLNNGVRGLMLDMYDFLNDVWLCHSFGGKCYNYTAFEPAINTLQEIEKFLSSNPSEIVTIFIEDYVHAPNGLTKVFTAAGLMKYWYPLAKMPKNGQDWPTVSAMVANNERLLVFTSIASKEASEGIAYEWNYLVENQYGNGGLLPGKCTNRAESLPLNSMTSSLVLENYFPDNPNQTEACTDNSKALLDMLSVCYSAAGKRWSNFLAVDFYKRSDGGGAFQAVDTLNGKLLCGCGDVHECQTNLALGVCNTTAAVGRNGSLPTAPPPGITVPTAPGTPTKGNPALSSSPPPPSSGGTSSSNSDHFKSLLCLRNSKLPLGSFAGIVLSWMLM
ncbi:hypothetical protein O6H91_06G010400 [Diphasiastrum complanatum]|uniref:Uncharacterized protein n=1 Tax=Diphasiastrum complanatum TaxID=34168 RepID=A0ACC2DAI0_DIPCM|nr:hypothetical protein O6H91_06G010400 [Diphasiastrum complanatum]